MKMTGLNIQVNNELKALCIEDNMIYPMEIAHKVVDNLKEVSKGHIVYLDNIMITLLTDRINVNWNRGS